MGSEMCIRDRSLSWHGFFSVIGVAVAVYMVIKQSRKDGIEDDLIFNVASWGVIGGIIGARLVHILDNLDYYIDNPINFLYIWRGGIGLWGGILGGLAGGVLYAKFIRLDRSMIGRLMDFAAPALLAAQAIGRIGDIINGEHCAAATSSPVSISYIHASSNAANCANGLGVAVHPVIIYEMCWYLAVFVIIWKLRDRLAPHGILFVLFLSLYSLGRFFITFYRDDRIWGLSLQEAHFISLIILFSSLTWMIYKIRWASTNDSES